MLDSAIASFQSMRWPMPNLADIHQAMMRMMEPLPPETWLLPAFILLLLGVTAAIDAFSGRIPDSVIVVGLITVVGVCGYYGAWQLGAQKLGYGLGAAIVVWLINQIYYNLMKRDAIGMGDAKWSALATAALGFKPVIIAWIVAAWLGLLWMGLARLLRGRLHQLHFAPFLFLGLLAGIYVIYIQGVG